MTCSGSSRGTCGGCATRPSCLLLLFGSTAAYSGAAHHNLHFGRSWRTVFGELIDEGRLMSDPSACW